MSRRARVLLVAVAPMVAAAAGAMALGAAAEVVLPVAISVVIAASLGASRALEFVDGPLEDVRRAAREAADGRRPGRPMAGRSGEAGRLARAVGDLAERVRSAEETARTQREIAGLFEHMGEGVALLDDDGRVMRSNGPFEDWLGRDSPEGERLTALIRDPGVREAVDSALSGAPASLEARRGEEAFLVDARPFRDGALVTVRDLTELRRLEGVRRDFVANVSHELKTPLTSVTGFAEALAGEPPEPGKAREFGQRILNNARRMRLLVDELLDLSRVESGAWEPEIEDVDVAATARSVWRSLPGSLRGDGPELDHSDAAHPVRADPDALRQILQNLLDNALRYSPSGEPVSVRTRREGDRIRVDVVDRGPGIPTAHRDRIFERFYRVDSGRARPEGGTGLGLAITRHLVLAHGGRIGVESEVDRGTTIWFTLEPAAGGGDESAGEG